MGKKYIVEEVEEKKEVGCGSIIVGVIVIGIIAGCGGFKSCQETDKNIMPSTTEQPHHKKFTETYLPSYVPQSPSIPTEAKSPSTSTRVKPQNETIKIVPIESVDTKETKTATTNISEDDLTPVSAKNQETTLTKKERRKAERQAKREARQMEKTQQN